jgi:hypothetical protein
MSANTRTAAVEEKAEALALQTQNAALWSSAIKPFVTDGVLVDKIDASVQYGVLLYSIIHPVRSVALWARAALPRSAACLQWRAAPQPTLPMLACRPGE